MRRYTVTVNDKSHVLDVEEVSADSFRVQVDGRLVDVRLEDHQDLAQAAITPGLQAGSVPAQVPALGADTGSETPIATPAPAAPTASAAPPPTGGGGNRMTAPMPGVILSVDAQVGGQVGQGDVVMVLEAMKMKNALHASRTGVVAEIYVSPGQQVKYGEALLRFEDE